MSQLSFTLLGAFKLFLALMVQSSIIGIIFGARRHVGLLTLAINMMLTILIIEISVIVIVLNAG